LNGRPWYFKDLKVTLLETAKTDPDMTVIINCGPNAKHLKLIKLLDACAEAKLTKLNIVNDESIRYVPARVK
jgi:biopolymer transport protein ExbD